ncbi:hypothetical protein [Roseibium sp. RKSG952]|uniref:hypothetical protein n=1 Tax=Roseibium sp. RKSG952 TaxID=2529384 RepID=UPI0012BCB2A3|nr:hypothetical protein [Roseibium sp. RKSG952]MTH94639.1 hypothetical protein [Roseibium sp. RKSG952]
MRKYVDRVRALPLALAAVAMIGIAEARAEAETVGDAAGDLIDDIEFVGKLAVAGGFLMGLVMVATGLLKLKAAAESQGGQVKYSEGMWRLAVGAGLVAIPALTGMLTQTLGFGSTDGISARGDANF